MRRYGHSFLGLVVGILIGIAVGPYLFYRTPPAGQTEETAHDDGQDAQASVGVANESEGVADGPDESVIADALEYIETMERVELPENGAWATCVRVVDGDTIEVEFEEGGSAKEKVRYIGVDTPETVHPSRGVEPYGPEASAVNKHMVEEKRVWLVGDITDRDRYGRLLRYVYTEDGLFVNLALVACGLAVVSTYPPDVAHVEEYVAAQEEAREAGRGFWRNSEEEIENVGKED